MRHPASIGARLRLASLVAIGFALAIVLAAATSASAEPVRTRDVVERDVALAAPATRIVVGSSMNLDALALAHPDPVSLIVGWSGLAASMDETQAAALRSLAPGIDAIPSVGRLSLDTLSIETLVALGPDLVVLNLYDLAGTPGSPADHPLVRRIEAMGIPVAVVDFFIDPLQHSAQSLRVIGDLLGTRERVEAFLDFYDAHMRAVAERLGGPDDALRRPRVFLHAHAAGADCCFSPGRGALDGFIRAAGGHNLGADLLSTPTGQVSLEALLSLQPDIYVATAGYAFRSESGFTLGRGVDAAEAQAGFERLLQRPGLQVLRAVSGQRAHGLWHDFTHSPLHVVAVETMARWFHPDRFADLDPAATLAEMNERFLALPLVGTFRVDQVR